MGLGRGVGFRLYHFGFYPSTGEEKIIHYAFMSTSASKRAPCACSDCSLFGS